jgi:sialic acid synthase SpsE
LTGYKKSITVQTRKKKKKQRRERMNRVSKKKGIYKEFLQLRIPRKMKPLIEKRAREKGMTLSEYVRFLIHKDLETRFENIDLSP